MSTYNFMTALISAFLLLVSVSASGEILYNRHPVRVIDGDTFERLGEKIRIRGIDTPELKTKDEKQKRLAVEAKLELERLLKIGYTVQKTGLDKYGRTVADIYINGENIADIMVLSGHGEAYLMKLPKARQQELLKLQQQAKNKGIGIWSKN